MNGPRFDWTIQLGDIVMAVFTLFGAPALWKFGTALFAMRDNLTKLVLQMGAAEPPSGVLGDISHAKRELRRHRDWLIEANIIHPSDRT